MNNNVNPPCGDENRSGLQENRGIKRRRCEIDDQTVAVASESSVQKEILELRQEILRLKAINVNTVQLHDKIQKQKEILEKENSELKEKLENSGIKNSDNCTDCRLYIRNLRKKDKIIDELGARVTRRDATINDCGNFINEQNIEIEELTNNVKAEIAKKDSEILNLCQKNDDLCKTDIARDLELETLRDKVKKYKEKIKLYKQSVEEKDEEIQQLQDDLSITDNLILEAEETISETQETFKEKDNKITKLQEKIEKQKNQIRSVRQQISNILKSVEERNTQIQNDFEARDSKINELQQLISGKESELSALQQTILKFQESEQEKDHRIQSLNADNLAKQDEIQNCQKAISTHLQVGKNKDDQILQLQEEISNYEKKHQVYEKVISDLQKKEKEISEQVRNAQQELKNQLEEIADLKGQVEIYAPAIDENKSLQDQIREKDAVLGENEKQLQESEKVVKAAYDQLVEMKETYKKEITKVEKISKELTLDLERTKENLKSFESFAVQVKVIAKWEANNNYPMVFQLDDFLNHVKPKLEFYPKLVESLRKHAERLEQQRAAALAVHQTAPSSPAKSSGQNEPSTSKQAQQQLRKVKNRIAKKKTDKRPKCFTCAKKFASVSQLNMHVKKVHGGNTKPVDLKNSAQQNSIMTSPDKDVDSIQIAEKSDKGAMEPPYQTESMDTEDELVDVVGDFSGSESSPKDENIMFTARPKKVQLPTSSKSIQQTLKQHGVGHSDEVCLCGIPFATSEKLQIHIGMHTKNGDF